MKGWPVAEARRSIGVLEIVVGEINSLAEPQGGGPPVVLTLGASVVSGTIIPDWQWFDEVEHAARAGFTVHTGGSIDDEHRSSLTAPATPTRRGCSATQ